MATVLHISATAIGWWGNGSGKWMPLPGPDAGPVWTVTDLTEEAFVEVTVPRIFGSDRKRYIERQLANSFPESRLRCALATHKTGSFMSRLAPPLQTLTAVDPSDRVTTALDQLTTPLVGVWSTSMLLTQLGQQRSLPAILLIVLSQPTGMRIVFLKNRAPVLTRLVATANTATEQAAEVLRTLRHLENTRVVERGNHRFAALLLGTAQGLAAALAADRLDAVDTPLANSLEPMQDCRPLLFDQVCKNPAGQLAPLRYRATYLARQVGKAAWGAGALCLVAAIWAASGNVSSLIRDQGMRTQLQASLGQTTSKIADADLALQTFGVSPETLRAALSLDTEEIVTAPDMEADFRSLAHIVSGINGARVKNLQWQILPLKDSVCSQGNLAAPTAAPTAAPVNVTGQELAPTRKVELQLTVTLAPGVGPRLKLQQATNISRQLSQLPGVRVVDDAARRLREGDISAGNTPSEGDQDLTYCAVFPGGTAAAAASAKDDKP